MESSREALRDRLPSSRRRSEAQFDEVGRRLGAIERRLSSLEGQHLEGSRFYLVAEPGFPNYGDELIAREWVRYLAQLRPEVPVTLDCAKPGNAASILMGLHPRLAVVDTVSAVAKERESWDLSEMGGVRALASWVRDTLELRGNPYYAYAASLLARRTRVVHYLGGGYLNGEWLDNLARIELGSWMAERGVPVLATGLGLVPLEPGSDTAGYVREVLAKFRAVGVRDVRSGEALAGLANVTVMPDDCFVNGLEGVASAEERLPRTMVCMQVEFGVDGNLAFRHVERILEVWGVRPGGEEVGVVECNPLADRGVYDYLVGRGYACRFFPTLYLLEQGLPVCEGQRWVSSRYHPHLVAAALGCSGCFVPINREYYGVKHEAVLRMGSRWNAAPMGEEPPQPGEGFADAGARLAYRDQIRAFASVLYGL